VSDFIAAHPADSPLVSFFGPLKAGLEDLQKATMWFMSNALAKPDNAGAGATDYMHLFGLVALGYMWARIAAASEERAKAGDQMVADELAIGRAYVERAMPETALRLARVTAGSDALMALPASAFQ
jgi:hypothetical protein